MDKAKKAANEYACELTDRGMRCRIEGMNNKDAAAKKAVMDLTREIRSVRPLDGGALCESHMIESLTPFLINMAMRNGLSDLGVKFV